MTWEAFKITLPAKWVLTGEHSVLVGATAVALPHPSLSLTLEFTPDPSLRSLVYHPEHTQEILSQLISELVQTELPSGRLSLMSQIPIGAGMGSSAALCVAITQWLAPVLGLARDQIIEFATQLEHKFHGKSSGMDVAVIASQMPIAFRRAQGLSGIQKLEVSNLPRFTFHDTGTRSRTRDCIEKVEKYRRDDPQAAQASDQRMGQASLIAVDGLRKFHSGEKHEALELLKRAIVDAQACFYDWGLVPQEAKQLEHELYAQGALAVKLTGAGGGGMMIALWAES